MTLYLADGQTVANVTFNTPNLTGINYLVIQSQYGKEVYNWVMTLVSSNDRYSEFQINISEAERAEHINAIYNYEVQQIINNQQVVIETGLLKYITEEGGAMGTEPYISSNENREAPTYYRPQY